MKFSKRTLELFAVVIVLVCIAVWSIPRFLRSQRSMADQYIQNDLDEVFKALRQYHADHNGHLPPELVDQQVAAWVTQHEGFTLRDSNRKNVNEVMEIMNQYGYADQNLDYLGDSYQIDCNIFFLREYPSKKIENFSILVPWKYDEHYSKGLYNKQVMGLIYITDGTFDNRSLYPAFYYHPSNGIQSNGVIYQDLIGARSTEQN